MIIAQTERLTLRHIEVKDYEFIFDLYNQPSFKQNIGDRGVHDLESAKTFIQQIEQHYENYGFWLYAVELTDSQQLIGVNGLVKRETLEFPDIGFAFLPHFWGKGFAFESAQAVVQHAKLLATDLNFKKILAVTSPHNIASEKLLIKAGFQAQGQTLLDNPNDPVNLFQLDLNSNSALHT